MDIEDVPDNFQPMWFEVSEDATTLTVRGVLSDVPRTFDCPGERIDSFDVPPNAGLLRMIAGPDAASRAFTHTFTPDD
jgi:hypothetical protein